MGSRLPVQFSIKAGSFVVPHTVLAVFASYTRNCVLFANDIVFDLLFTLKYFNQYLVIWVRLLVSFKFVYIF